MLGKFYGIGVGPGDPSMLTLKAVQVLKESDVIFEAVGLRSKKSISASIVDSVEGLKAERVSLVFSMDKDSEIRDKYWTDNAEKIIEQLKQGKICSFVTIGDPLIYSTFVYLMRKVEKGLSELEVEVVPGITSFQYSAAQARMPIVEDREILTVIPAFENENIPDILDVADTTVLLKTYKNRDDIIRNYEKAGYSQFLYAERVGLSDEFVSRNPKEISSRPKEYISHIITKRKND